MNYFKSPLNWVGNKYKVLGIINQIVKNKKYDNIIECFMGCGNILFNIEANANNYIGNDKNKLTPEFYNVVKNYNHNYTLDEFNDILKMHNDFKNKDDYYKFREYWNTKFLSNKFDVNFIYETTMLLKMCSNSMVRFNPKTNKFNQGFRGYTKNKIEKDIGFFTDTMRYQCITRLNELNKNLHSKEYTFYNKDFADIEEIKKDNNLLILDPPYILSSAMYDTDYSLNSDKQLFDLIKNTNNDFLYFNYLKSDNKFNKDLLNLVNEYDFQIVEINNKELSGQNRSVTKEVSEVIVHNVR